MRLEEIKKICREEGADVKDCKIKADYIKALEKHRDKSIESVRASVSFSGSEEEEEEKETIKIKAPAPAIGVELGHVRGRVEDMNRVLSEELRETSMAPTQTSSSQAQGEKTMLASIKEMMNENTAKLTEEVRRSVTDTEEKLKRDREEISREVKGLRNDVEEVRCGLVTKKDVEDMVKDLKESQAKHKNEYQASNEALIKKFAENDYEYKTGLAGMRREVAELTKKVDNMRTYPVMSENRTNSQIMSVVTQFETVQRNVIIRGIPEMGGEDEDKKAIMQELQSDFHIFKSYTRAITRNVVRVGRKNERGTPRPVKVSFESVRIRDEFLREAKDIEDYLREEWIKWKNLHPNDYLEDNWDKPRYRKYNADTPSLIRQKVKEIVQVCQLLPVAGPHNMHTPVCVKLKNGDAKLMMCSPGQGGKWISEAGGVEAETIAADLLRDFAIKKGYKTKSVMAFTGAGAYLPDMRHLQPELRGIFTGEVKKAWLEDIIRSREVRRAVGFIEGAVREEEGSGGTEDPGEEGKET